MKVVFERITGKILGAQAVGPHQGVDKRIDVLSTAIQAGFTVFDLEELELCYSPPYGSAKDPSNFAGFVGKLAFLQQGVVCCVENKSKSSVKSCRT